MLLHMPPTTLFAHLYQMVTTTPLSLSGRAGDWKMRARPKSAILTQPAAWVWEEAEPGVPAPGVPEPGGPGGEAALMAVAVPGGPGGPGGPQGSSPMTSTLEGCGT